MHIDREHRPLLIDLEESRLPASGDLADKPLHNPSLLQEFFHDERNGASLQSRRAGKVGARDRLSYANLVEDQIAIDVTRRSVRGALLLFQKQRHRHHRIRFLPCARHTSLSALDTAEWG